jgi:hypothetical protein
MWLGSLTLKERVGFGCRIRMAITGLKLRRSSRAARSEILDRGWARARRVCRFIVHPHVYGSVTMSSLPQPRPIMGAQPVRDFQHRFQAEGPDAVFSRTRFLLRLNRQNVREHRGGLNPDPKNLDAMQAILEDRARLIQRDQYRMAA